MKTLLALLSTLALAAPASDSLPAAWHPHSPPPRAHVTPPGSPATAKSFQKELLDAIDERWSQLRGQSIEQNPWRDKKSFKGFYLRLKEERDPKPKELKKVGKKLASLLRKEKAPHFQWRAQQLLGQLHLDCADPKKAATALDAALEAYPNDPYATPSKQSLFHHIANERAGVAWELQGREAAEGFIFELLGKDERFRFFYTPWWRTEMEAREPSRLGGFFEELKQALAEKAQRDTALAEAFERIIEDIDSMVYAHFVEGDPKKKYYVLGDIGTERAVDLVFTLPGGHGQAAEFLSWLTSVESALEEDQLMVVVSAPQWSEKQTNGVVWVTDAWRKTYDEADFGIEGFLEEVLGELEQQVAVRNVALFGWSSSGPAIYESVLRKDSPWIGAYVHASVFKPDRLELDLAAGKRFFLRQGTKDRVTALRFAKDAERRLSAKKAEVELEIYEGGHGWDLPNAPAKIAAALNWIFSKRGSN